MLLLLAFLCAATAACGSAAASAGSSTTSASRASATVSGKVKAGPTCPVEQLAKPCPDRPLVNFVVEASTPSGNVAGSARTGRSGRYSIAVAPGRYRLTVVAAKVMPRCPVVAVTVKTGGATRADFTCDTGIR